MLRFAHSCGRRPHRGWASFTLARSAIGASTRPGAAVPAALVCSCRCSSGTGSSSSSSSSSGSSELHAVSADELRRALHTLGLAEKSTDAEVKRAFHAFVMLHHPDTRAVTAPRAAEADTAGGKSDSGVRSHGGVDAADRIRGGTEAYHLLRRVPHDVRQQILQESSSSSSSGGARGRRLRNPRDTEFEFTEEEYAKAQRVYEGGRRAQRSSRRGHGDDAGSFDMRTEDGRRRTARLNEFQERILNMRRRGLRDDLPPWRVHDGGAADSGSSSSGGGDDSGGRDRHGNAYRSSGPRNPQRLGLKFFGSTAAGLREVRELYRSRPGFAGMDGSAYDNDASAARVAPELSANPHLRQYILMKHRAQERAIVDRAVQRPLLLFVVLVCVAAAVVMGVGMASAYRARMRQDTELRRADEERGGG
ncbi:hypothetical protein NESM_000240600 [Novymonas esmeraldas]|uniref:J domain-containing protein n=1 Tax=Novymonas esmeraldas TaxID=1808958 RepID=A0AAW0FC39_9TRYP